MKKALIATIAAASLAGSAAIIFATASGVTAAPADEIDTPITGQELASASSAALAHLGGGTVTDTEVGDEDSYYEVEVTLDNGQQVDVQLDKEFTVVNTEAELAGEDSGE